MIRNGTTSRLIVTVTLLIYSVTIPVISVTHFHREILPASTSPYSQVRAWDGDGKQHAAYCEICMRIGSSQQFIPYLNTVTIDLPLIPHIALLCEEPQHSFNLPVHRDRAPPQSSL